LILNFDVFRHKLENVPCPVSNLHQKRVLNTKQFINGVRVKTTRFAMVQTQS
jgi:hypothetical protein